MRNQESDYSFGDLIREYKSEIYKENGDLTLFGGLIFVFYGCALIFAIKRLQKKGFK